MYRQLKYISTAHKWFWAAFVLLAFFLVYTAIFSSGVLLNLTLQMEQWLLHRPLTGADCIFRVWSSVGEVPFSLLFTFLLGIGCLLLGYRRRVLPYLLLLLLLGAGVEFEGKQIFPQPLPVSLRSGIDSLRCPQIAGQPYSVKLLVLLGIWWEVPEIPPERVLNAQYSATAPLILNNAPPDYSYPSGHAIRWSFLGLVVCWLVWRHMKCAILRVLRGLLMALALAVAFGGGFAQFYTGFHLATDLIAGYLMGASTACWAIGLLQRNDKNMQKEIL